MIAFYIEGQYGDTDGDGVTLGVTEWCYDRDGSAFLIRWRAWACDDWRVLQRMDLPNAAGIGLLNALAHAEPDCALRVAEHIAAVGPRREVAS